MGTDGSEYHLVAMRCDVCGDDWRHAVDEEADEIEPWQGKYCRVVYNSNRLKIDKRRRIYVRT